MKALFFTIPGHGHINPSLPIIAELGRRGHHIVCFVTEGFKPTVEAAGAESIVYDSIHDDLFTADRLHGGVGQKVAYVLLTNTQAALPDMLEQSRALEPDLILYDGMCPW